MQARIFTLRKKMFDENISSKNALGWDKSPTLVKITESIDETETGISYTSETQARCWLGQPVLPPPARLEAFAAQKYREAELSGLRCIMSPWPRLRQPGWGCEAVAKLRILKNIEQDLSEHHVLKDTAQILNNLNLAMDQLR